ncbi:unnamed protein product [Urochloa decumbens]|uniref:Receptor kinase-like protein Xa21 n=1 Tax=Urochloa decumbens TaxID=240449 RepID=A0ABC8V9P2_9POAL
MVRASAAAFLFTALVCSSASAASPGSGSASAADVLALLSVKSALLDPAGSLASWNATNHVCRWRGVGCGRRHPERVVALRMSSFGLSGRISPSVGNLTFLRALDLGNNLLAGQMPRQVGSLSRLRLLNLSFNSLDGGIPAELGRCTRLRVLALTTNQLQGEVPVVICSLRNLVVLDLFENGLSGEISPFMANLSSIEFLRLSKNTFSGTIPPSLGGLPNLSVLSIYYNNLSGTIPTTIWNISSLTKLSVVGNQLSGEIPANAFDSLPLLQGLYMSSNQFHGSIPTSLANASNLLSFQIVQNYFTGTVPPVVRHLPGLQYLLLANNSLEANKSEDWNFMTALTNCSRLEHLELDSNRFGGLLPVSISNLSSTSLIELSFSDNEIFGHIPESIGNLIGLNVLGLENNDISGSLPSSLTMLQNLGYLSLQHNNISGSIRSIGNLSLLNYLYLDHNAFRGTIPVTIGNLTSLIEFTLANNYFTGTIPGSLFNIPTLSQQLDLAHNLLEGQIPSEIGNLKGVVWFRADSNKLSGEIPATLGQCQLLQYLNLRNNSLSGSIPFPLFGLKALENLDLSINNLSGQIPAFLGNLSTLNYLDLSFNNFDGEVPTFGVFRNTSAVSVEGNNKLCGGVQQLHLPQCSSRLSKGGHKFPVIQVVVPIVAALLGILLLFYFFLTCHKKIPNENRSTSSMQGHPKVSYSQLVKATDGFSTTNLLGSGTFGSVYKGNLEDEGSENTVVLVAIKVMKLQAPGALKSFTAECEAIRNLRHRNLVRIITACSSIDYNGNDFRAIVFDFMPNGSLEDWLHSKINNEREKRQLSLFQRVSILHDVASALDYLHFQGGTPIVHCDLKPSNVLLDAGMVAHVGDFGLAKILAEGWASLEPSTSSMGFRGTIGYAPPEYGAGHKVSTQGDIYSYGILVLETITGRRPTDNAFDGVQGLRTYVEMAIDNKVMDIIHVELVKELENEYETLSGPSEIRLDSLVSLLKLGMLCSVETPSSRISTKEIISELYVIKNSLA